MASFMALINHNTSAFLMMCKANHNGVFIASFMALITMTHQYCCGTGLMREEKEPVSSP
jgi:hypothetical protein